MGMPKSLNGRLFFRNARERLDDAGVVLDANRTTGSVYMAGYCVEYSLKALILEQTPEPKHDEVLATFRGAIAHDVDWLHAQYRRRGGVFPAEMLRHLSLFRTYALSPWNDQSSCSTNVSASDQEVLLVDGRNLLTCQRIFSAATPTKVCC